MNTEGLRGNFFGRTLVQQRGEIGGARDVFVKLGGLKNDLIFPTFGGRVMNPFKGAAKIYAGDLIEYRTNDKGVNPEIYLLKTYQVAKATSNTTIQIVRDGYKHKPFVGDVLMKAPDTIGGTGAAYTITAVVAKDNGGDASNEKVWEITVDTALGSLNKGDVLVEAEEENASGSMLVKNINAVAPCDYDFLHSDPSDPSDETDEFDKARYYMTPALGGLMYKHKMSPVPACVEKACNEVKVNGWFGFGLKR